MYSHEDQIDFPVSWSWWRYYSREFTGIDPGPNEPIIEEAHPMEIAETYGDEPRKQYDQLREMVLYLQGKLNEHTDKSLLRKKSPPPTPPKEYRYNTIKIEDEKPFV